MTAGRWTPNTATPGRAETRVISEFQRELANGDGRH
jgi:hypothetical protein